MCSQVHAVTAVVVGDLGLGLDPLGALRAADEALDVGRHRGAFAAALRRRARTSTTRGGPARATAAADATSANATTA